MNILQNENLIVESIEFGAELTRIFSKKDNREILWTADDKYWAKHSPILFPVVGRLKDFETSIDEKTYSMQQHGFARNMNFEVINTSDNSISYSLTSNEETKSLYPYSFELIITYVLNENSLTVKWCILNKDDKDIYFSIGAHPGFNLPFNEGENLSDYYLQFNHKKDTVENITLDVPYVSGSKFIGNIDRLNLTSDLFKNDALIYTNIDEISIKSNTHDNFVKLSFKDFPLVGIWTPYYNDTKSIAPFLCIEPWYGLADKSDSDKIYKNKDYINKLSVNDKFTASYDIIIG